MANRLLILLLCATLPGCISPEIPTTIPGTIPDGPISGNISMPMIPQPNFSGSASPETQESPAPQSGTQNIPGPSPERMTIGNQTGGRFLLTEVEHGLFKKVNAEREKEGLHALVWDDDLLPAARSHSLALAEENLPITEPALFCKRPFLHHEGFDGGLYAIDRLYNMSVYHFASVGENLFVAPTSGESLTYDPPQVCPEDGSVKTVQEVEALLDDYRERLAFVDSAQRVSWASIEWKSQGEVEDSIVQGWMESPGHRANILEPEFDQSAIGVAQVNDYLVVTQIFIDRVECGYRGAQCCLEGKMLYCYEPWTCSDYHCS